MADSKITLDLHVEPESLERIRRLLCESLAADIMRAAVTTPDYRKEATAALARTFKEFGRESPLLMLPWEWREPLSREAAKVVNCVFARENEKTPLTDRMIATYLGVERIEFCRWILIATYLGVERIEFCRWISAPVALPPHWARLIGEARA